MLRSFTFALSCAALAFATTAANAQSDALPDPPEFPDENLPLDPDQAVLGKFLFWEEQIGGDNTVACGTCHIHEAGGSDPRANDADSIHPGFDGIFGTDDDVRGSKGVVSFDQVAKSIVFEPTFFPNVQVTGRKTPPTINAAHFTSTGVFWDGRAEGEFTDPQSGQVAILFAGALESQAVGPPLSDVEMSGVNQGWDQIVAELETATPMALASNLPTDMSDFLAVNPTYPDMFEAAYGDDEINSERIAFAIANYERTLISDNTDLDSFLDGNPATPLVTAGLDLFNGDANCASCHTLPFTSDLSFHNIGLRPDVEDIGLEATTGSPFDRAKFKTPNIRNAALREPLFHNGSRTIEELVDFYIDGGDFNTEGNLDPLMLDLNGVIDATERQTLIDFLTIAVTDPDVINNVHPFTRPTLGSEAAAFNTIYGVPTLDSQGEEAIPLAHVPGNVGHQEFMIGVHNARPNQPASLMFAFEQDPNGTLFKDPAFPVNVNLIVSSIFLFMNTATDANGVASINLPLPKDPALQGLTVYAQWVVKDPMVPGRIYTSKGIEIPFF